MVAGWTRMNTREGMTGSERSATGNCESDYDFNIKKWPVYSPKSV